MNLKKMKQLEVIENMLIIKVGKSLIGAEVKADDLRAGVTLLLVD